jgi:hypothetical protein
MPGFPASILENENIPNLQLLLDAQISRTGFGINLQLILISRFHRKADIL